MTKANRVDVDAQAKQGRGFPMAIPLSILDLTASVTNNNRWKVPANFGKSARKGTFVISEIQAHVATAGTGNTTVTVKATGSVNLSWTITISSTTPDVVTDVRDANGNGIVLQAGDVIQLDMGSIGQSGTTAGVGVIVVGMAFGVGC